MVANNSDVMLDRVADLLHLAGNNANDVVIIAYGAGSEDEAAKLAKQAEFSINVRKLVVELTRMKLGCDAVKTELGRRLQELSHLGATELSNTRYIPCLYKLQGYDEDNGMLVINIEPVLPPVFWGYKLESTEGETLAKSPSFGWDGYMAEHLLWGISWGKELVIRQNMPTKSLPSVDFRIVLSQRGDRHLNIEFERRTNRHYVWSRRCCSAGEGPLRDVSVDSFVYRRESFFSFSERVKCVVEYRPANASDHKMFGSVKDETDIEKARRCWGLYIHTYTAQRLGDRTFVYEIVDMYPMPSPEILSNVETVEKVAARSSVATKLRSANREFKVVQRDDLLVGEVDNMTLTERINFIGEKAVDIDPLKTIRKVFDFNEVATQAYASTGYGLLV